MFVVADEAAVRISGQGSLAGAGETEEDRGVAVLPDVGRTVHGEHILLVRKDVVEYREDTLLDLACVPGAPDQDDLLAEVDDGEIALTRSVQFWVRFEAGSRDDGPLRFYRL